MNRTKLPFAAALVLALLIGCGTSPSPPPGTGTGPGPSGTAAPGGGSGGGPPTTPAPVVYRNGSARFQVSGGVNASYSLKSIDPAHELTVPAPTGSGLVWEDPAGDQLQISWASDAPASGVSHTRTLVVYLAMMPGNELVEATSVHGECRVSLRHADASGFSGRLACGGLQTDFRSTIQVHGTFSASA